MSFTFATITHTFANADGTPASGTAEFTLTARMSQPADTIMPGSVTATLNGSGAISQSLASNLDSGTVPEDAQWRVDVRIAGASEETFFIVVPTGGGTFDLMALLPQQPLGG